MLKWYIKNSILAAACRNILRKWAYKLQDMWCISLFVKLNGFWAEKIEWKTVSSIVSRGYWVNHVGYEFLIYFIFNSLNYRVNPIFHLIS